jgi:photosystem II stability/assembly factor-like uncharacterized protein
MKSSHAVTSLFRFIAILLLCAAVICPGRADRAAPAIKDVVYQEDFEDGQAQGWQLEPGWQVISDGGNQVLAGQGHVWARSNQSFDDDYRLSFRVKLLQGTIHLVYRMNDVGRYFVGFQSQGSYLSRQIWPDQFQNELSRSYASYGQNTWHQIQIVGQGSSLRFYVDGAQQWAYSDPQPLGNGSFAFETLDDSRAYVDDIVADMASAQPAGQTAPNPDAPASSTSNLTWVRTGGPLGGLGYDIRMRPDNPDTMFVTDAWAGAFISNDGGQSWFPSSDGISTRVGPSGDAIPVFSLTVDQNNPDIVWAGTQFQRGIFKSTDGGRSWTKMDSGVVEKEGITFRGFTVQPGNSNVVYAAAEVSSWAWTPNRQERRGREFDLTQGVVYKTTNGGQSWQPSWRGQNLARYIWVNPQNAKLVYVSTGIFDREAANSDPASVVPGGEGVLKSTDAGATWTNVNNGLGNLYVGSLFMHPTDPNILLAGTGNNQYQAAQGVYLSLDGGNSWQQTLSTQDAITSVEMAPSNPNIAYAAGRSAVYRSEDGGRNWQPLTSGNVWGSPTAQTGFPIDFQVDPRNPDRIFTNAYGGGSFLSEDGGRTWRDDSKGYTGAQVRDIVVDPTAPGRVVAVARSGVFASYNGGSDWVGINPSNVDSIEWNAISIDPSNPRHLVGGLNVHGWLVNSDNGGQTWATTSGPYDDRKGWRAIAFAPSNPNVIYAGSASYYSASYFEASQPAMGIFASQDGGESWSSANDGLSQDAHVTALAVDPANHQRVFAATTNHGLLNSGNGGGSWAQIGSGLPTSRTMLSVAMQPTNPNTLFAGFERGAIFKSTDGGQSWKRSASGLAPEATVSDIVFDPTNAAQVLYLTDQQSGVYRSRDGGASWQVISTGLLSRSVNALAISGDGLHLYAAVEGAGVYRLDLNGQAPESAAPAGPLGAQPAQPGNVPVQPPVATTSAATTKSPLRNLPCCGTLMLPIAILALLGPRPRLPRMRR